MCKRFELDLYINPNGVSGIGTIGTVIVGLVCIITVANVTVLLKVLTVSRAVNPGLGTTALA